MLLLGATVAPAFPPPARLVVEHMDLTFGVADSVRLVGRLANVPAQDPLDLALQVGCNSDHIQLASPTAPPGTYGFKASDPAAPGLSAVTLTADGHLTATIVRTAISHWQNPLIIRGLVNDASFCAVVAFTPVARDRWTFRTGINRQYDCGPEIPPLSNQFAGEASVQRVAVGWHADVHGAMPEQMELTALGPDGVPVGVPLCTLMDDGRGEDSEAHDGMFTGVARFPPAKPGRRTFSVQTVVDGQRYVSPAAVVRTVPELASAGFAAEQASMDAAAAAYAATVARLGHTPAGSIAGVMAMRRVRGIAEVWLLDGGYEAETSAGLGMSGGCCTTDDPLRLRSRDRSCWSSRTFATFTKNVAGAVSGRLP